MAKPNPFEKSKAPAGKKSEGKPNPFAKGKPAAKPAPFAKGGMVKKGGRGC